MKLIFGAGAGEDNHAFAAIFIRIEFRTAVDSLDSKAAQLQEQADFTIEEVAKDDWRDGAFNRAIPADFIINPVDAEKLLGAVKVADRILHD